MSLFLYLEVDLQLGVLSCATYSDFCLVFGFSLSLNNNFTISCNVLYEHLVED